MGPIESGPNSILPNTIPSSAAFPTFARPVPSTYGWPDRLCRSTRSPRRARGGLWLYSNWAGRRTSQVCADLQATFGGPQETDLPYLFGARYLHYRSSSDGFNNIDVKKEVVENEITEQLKTSRQGGIPQQTPLLLPFTGESIGPCRSPTESSSWD